MTSEVETGAPLTPYPFRYYQVASDEYWRALPDRGLVEFWDGEHWRISVMPNRLAFLDDVLGSGVTVRELMDLSELPAELRDEGKDGDR